MPSESAQLIIVAVCVLLASAFIARRVWKLVRSPAAGCASGGCGSCANNATDAVDRVERPLVQLDLTRPPAKPR